MKVSDFNYELPEKLIAQVPIKDRSASRLMVLHKDTQTIEHKVFKDIIGLKKWYTVYIQNSIKNSKGEKVGLSQEIHLEKPIHESNFKYSYELNELKEPKNFIEEMNCLIKRVKQLFQR